MTDVERVRLFAIAQFSIKRFLFWLANHLHWARGPVSPKHG